MSVFWTTLNIIVLLSSQQLEIMVRYPNLIGFIHLICHLMGLIKDITVYNAGNVILCSVQSATGSATEKYVVTECQELRYLIKFLTAKCVGNTFRKSLN